ncbi:MAG: LacI family transcriptional regulator, partial [Candidatus Omnitrophica bacterium]|nr:LacI family transcriptional regulator [Candidatus Omnitrophota bacterium]
MAMKTYKQANVVEQIADRLNIAVSTVYAILADRKSCYASQGLKQQVKKLAMELGYRPNYIAVSLKKGKTGTIGLIVSDMHAETTLARLEHMTKLARNDRYHVFFGCSYNNPVLEEELLQEFFYRRVDGIAIAPARKGVENRFLGKLVEMGFPIITFTRVENIDIDYVSTDYFSGGYIAGEHLLKMGYENLGFIGTEIATIAVEERFEGFKKALVDNGCGLDDPRVVLVDTDTSKGIEDGSKRLLEAGVDGVFCTNDRV